MFFFDFFFVVFGFVWVPPGVHHLAFGWKIFKIMFEDARNYMNFCAVGYSEPKFTVFPEQFLFQGPGGAWAKWCLWGGSGGISLKELGCPLAVRTPAGGAHGEADGVAHWPIGLNSNPKGPIGFFSDEK